MTNELILDLALVAGVAVFAIIGFIRGVQRGGLGPVSRLSDFARLDASEWTRFLEEKSIGAPRSVVGDNPKERLATYAESLARKLETRFPTAAFAADNTATGDVAETL